MNILRKDTSYYQIVLEKKLNLDKPNYNCVIY